MLNGWEADELTSTASRFNARQLSELAVATRKSLGSGVAAYFGLNRNLKPSIDAANTAGRQAGRGEMMEVKSAALVDAIVRAAVVAATTRGRDASAVPSAWETFKASVDSGDSRRRHMAFRESRKVFRRGLGRPLDRQWLMASIGAGWALTAILTWDLAGDNGPYLLQHRDALTRPWRLVAPLPPSRD